MGDRFGNLPKIGDISLPNRLILAPMAGVTDLAFRRVCRELGAGTTYTEMVSCKALAFGDKKTDELLALSADEHPVALQIFGCEPDIMAQGARIAFEKSGATWVDINMGCPTPKIVKSGEGSALMQNPDLASKIIEAVVSEMSPVPVSVKFRLGWDEGSKNAIEFAKMAEGSGAAAIAVHGRTRAQMYGGKADWDMLAQIRAAVNLPFIANGDVVHPSDSVKILEHTGADFVMIGRGALGNPFIFREALALLQDLPKSDPPDMREKMAVALRQFEFASAQKGERRALCEARSHMAWYLKGFRGSAYLRGQASKIATLSDLRALISEVLGTSIHK